jgi:hypothetical protein
MGRGYFRGFTAAEKTELWDRWQGGESLKAIGRAFGKPSSSNLFSASTARGNSSFTAASLETGVDAGEARLACAAAACRRRDNGKDQRDDKDDPRWCIQPWHGCLHIKNRR